MTARTAGSPWVPGGRVTRGGADVLPEDGDGPVVGVLALQGDVLEHLRALADVGARPRRVRSLRDLGEVDALVIPGGESTTIGRQLVRADLLEPLRARVHAGMPTFGTCAGLILLSRELAQEVPQPLIGGLDVRTRRNAFGRQVDSFEVDLEIEGMGGGPVRAVFIRAPWIEEVGTGVDVLATVRGHPVLVAQGHVVGASFHPELTADRRLHAWFVERARSLTAHR